VVDKAELSRLSRKHCFYLDSGGGHFYACSTMTAFELKRWMMWLEGISRKSLYIMTRQPVSYHGTVEWDQKVVKVMLMITRNALSLVQTAGDDGKALEEGSFVSLWRHTFAELMEYRALFSDAGVPSGLELNFGVHRKEPPTAVQTEHGAVAINIIHSLIMETFRRRQEKAVKAGKSGKKASKAKK